MMRRTRSMSAPSGNSKSFVIGVLIDPGHTALHRSPRFAYSTAIVRVSASTPPFDAEYAAAQGWPDSAAVDDTLTMFPFDSSSAGIAARQHRNVPVRLT